MHDYGIIETKCYSKVVTLADLPEYNPDSENQYDFHLKLCMLADLENDGTLCRFELARVHQYFNVAYGLWYYNDQSQCPSLSDSER